MGYKQWQGQIWVFFVAQTQAFITLNLILTIISILISRLVNSKLVIFLLFCFGIARSTKLQFKVIHIKWSLSFLATGYSNEKNICITNLDTFHFQVQQNLFLMLINCQCTDTAKMFIFFVCTYHFTSYCTKRVIKLACKSGVRFTKLLKPNS